MKLVAVINKFCTEAYSCRENLKFKGIPELPESSGQQDATSKEDTKEVLTSFMENVLEIEDAKDIEFQRVHGIGKPKTDNGMAAEPS